MLQCQAVIRIKICRNQYGFASSGWSCCIYNGILSWPQPGAGEDGY